MAIKNAIAMDLPHMAHYKETHTFMVGFANTYKFLKNGK